MTKQERKSRVIARGEFSNHSHVMVGDCEVEIKDGKTLIHVNDDSNVCLKHLLESDWLKGNEVWSNEHTDISLTGFPTQVRQGDVLLSKCGERTYEYIQQVEYNPYDKKIQEVRD